MAILKHISVRKDEEAEAAQRAWAASAVSATAAATAHLENEVSAKVNTLCSNFR